MLTSRLQGMQIKKEYAYNQSYARASAMLSDMGQMQKERGESHEWALINFLLNYIQWHLSLFKTIFFFLSISISSPAVWITKINKCISETLFFYFIFHINWATALCCDWRFVQGGFLLATPYIFSNIAHGIVYNSSHIVDLTCASFHNMSIKHYVFNHMTICLWQL